MADPGGKEVARLAGSVPATRQPVQEQTELTLEVVKKWINPKVTDAEAFFFLSFCKANKLDPFKKEIYLIKYGNQDASMVTSKDTFAKRAERNPAYKGFKAGLILLDNSKQIVYREGSFSLEGEVLLGGWCEVYRSDRTSPIRNEVGLAEYEGKKADGTVTKMWTEKPSTMIRKVAFCQSHREAFPDELGGIYGFEEMGFSESQTPTYEVGKPPEIPVSPEMVGYAPPKERGGAPEKAAGAPVGGEAAPGGEAAGDAAPAREEGAVTGEVLPPEGSGGNGRPSFMAGCARKGLADRQNMNGNPGSANEKQIGKINVVLNKLGWKADEDRHLAVGQMLGVGPFKSLKDLSMREASAVIDVLVEMEKVAGK